MTAPNPCDWPIDTGCDETFADLDDALQARATGLAVLTLRRLTGYRVGGCPVTVRPCRQSCNGGAPAYQRFMEQGSGWMYPALNPGGSWINIGCGCGYASCSCSAVNEVALPAPATSIVEVTLDGAVIPATDYRIDDMSKLVYTGAGAGWPLCQDMNLTSGVGTFFVTYMNTYPVSPEGQWAAGVLASEYAKACTGGKCRLPAGVTSVVRQGLSMNIISGSFPDGETGIREVDAFIAAWNPLHLTQRPTVWSPDLARSRSTTWTSA